MLGGALFKMVERLDDGWPESAEEHVTLVLLVRASNEYIKDVL